MVEILSIYHLEIFLWLIGAMFTFGYAFIIEVPKQYGGGVFLYLILSIFFWPFVIGGMIGNHHGEVLERLAKIINSER